LTNPGTRHQKIIFISIAYGLAGCNDRMLGNGAQARALMRSLPHIDFTAPALRQIPVIAHRPGAVLQAKPLALALDDAALD
jgi:hypothetical protein